jgi:hypothetical protein
MHLHECVVERRVRTDKRWDVDVGGGGGKPGSNAKVWRSLDVDQYADVELAERNHHHNKRRTVATRGAARSGGGVFLRVNRRKTRHDGLA